MNRESNETDLSFKSVEAPDNMVYTGLGVTEERANELDRVAVMELNTEERSMSDSLAELSGYAQNPQELMLLGYFLGMNAGARLANPFARLFSE